MREKVFEADTVDEAVKKGLREWGVPQEAVEVEIIQEGRKGFLGFGQRPAIVKLFAESVDKKPSQEEVSDRSEHITIPDPVTESVAEPAMFATEEIIVDDQTGDVAQTNSEFVSVSEEAVVIQEAQSKAKIADKPAQNTHVKCEDVDFPARYIIDVLEAYGVDVTVDVEDLDTEIIYHINTDKPGLVIGKHGKILNALEDLVKVLVHRHVRNRVHVSVNVGDYRERRMKILERLAERVADEVTVTERAVKLDPLPASERKIVHQALSQYDHIKTRSQGKEPYRYLVAEYK